MKNIFDKFSMTRTKFTANWHAAASERLLQALPAFWRTIFISAA